MKITSSIIARTLVDAADTQDVSALPELCDAALVILRKRCPYVPLRTFFVQVERLVRRRQGDRIAILSTPKGSSPQAGDVLSALKAALGKPVSLEEVANPDLIGGAVILLGELRIDRSVRRALADLHAVCMEPIAA